MHNLDPLATAPRDHESRAIGTRTLQQRETNDPRPNPRPNNTDVIPDNVSRTILPTSRVASVASEIVAAPSTANSTTNPGAISSSTPMPTASTPSASFEMIASKSQCPMRSLLGMKPSRTTFPPVAAPIEAPNPPPRHQRCSGRSATATGIVQLRPWEDKIGNRIIRMLQ